MGPSFQTPISNTWARLTLLPHIGNLPGLFATEAEWNAQGIDPHRMGLRPLAEAQDQKKPVPVPQFGDLFLDLYLPREIRVVRMPSDTVVPRDSAEVVVEGVFDDEHPEPWITALTTKRQAVLAVGPAGPQAFTKRVAWERTWRIGIIGVAENVASSWPGFPNPA